MSYVTNSPSQDHGWVSEEEEMLLRVYLLPEWIYRAFTSKYNLVEIHALAKLRDVASALDVAQVAILSQSLFDQPELRVTESGWFRPSSLVFDAKNRQELTEEGRRERDVTVYAYTQDLTIQKALWSRLRDLAGNDNSEAVALDVSLSPKQELKPPYRIVLLQGELYIIVEEGFLSRISEGNAKAAFFADVLKSAYAVAPISVVNRSVWYRQYVAALPA